MSEPITNAVDQINQFIADEKAQTVLPGLAAKDVPPMHVDTEVERLKKELEHVTSLLAKVMKQRDELIQTLINRL